MDAKKGTISANFAKSETLGSLATTAIAFAVSKGMTLDELTEDAADLAAVDYARLDSRISDASIGELMSRIANRWPNTAISMEIASAASFSMLGGLVQGAQFASDIEAVLDWFITNQTILADLSAVHLEHTNSEVAIVVAHPNQDSDRGMLLEAVTGLVWRLLKENTDWEISLLRVEFSHAKPVPGDAYESFFQAPVLFQAGRSALVFSKESLSVPIRDSNPQLFDLISCHFAELREQLGSDRYPIALANLRRSIMENAVEGEYTAAAAAAKANISLRTAQRLARQHDTTLSVLINEIRMANAKSLLSDPEFDIETVGQVVGYADARAFRRAFKRWNGLSPKAYRKEKLRES